MYGLKNYVGGIKRLMKGQIKVFSFDLGILKKCRIAEMLKGYTWGSVKIVVQGPDEKKEVDWFGKYQYLKNIKDA